MYFQGVLPTSHAFPWLNLHTCILKASWLPKKSNLISAQNLNFKTYISWCGTGQIDLYNSCCHFYRNQIGDEEDYMRGGEIHILKYHDKKIKNLCYTYCKSN